MSLVSVSLLRPARHSAPLEGLPPAEQARAARFLHEADRRRYLLGRTAIRRLCAERLGCRPAEAPLVESPRGKPHLAPEVATAAGLLEFNLAHSGDYVAVAWSLGGAVGIDLEPLNRQTRRSFAELARTAFSLEEQAVLRAAAAAGDEASTFYRLWVRKEAIVKAEGCGIAGALQQFSVARPAAEGAHWLAHISYPDSGECWQLSDFPGPADYALAVAIPAGFTLQAAPPSRLGWS